MKRRQALLVIAALAAISSLSFTQEAQNPTAGQRPAAPVRIGPPPATATAEELEKQADHLRAEKSYADALDYYRAAIKKANSAPLWNKVGITELQTGHLKDAAKSFERSIKLDSKFPEAYNNRGAVYYIAGTQQQALAEQKHKSVPRGAVSNYRKSVNYYLKALALREDSASYHANLGTAYFALKDFPQATNEYARAMELDPDVLEHRFQTGITAQMSSPEDRAHYSFVVARMYAKSGNLERALQYLRKAIEDGYKDLDSVYKDQEFATLRKDPRFSELMARKPTAIPQ
ncbi:MAG TPA: tetratricopeptide repeat protein [Terriglobales bacterium]|jgi:tetratricopeptide (TPR) repeat protein|nr:tetratricopeptide repeat protein [Terriglobales bacterium]HET7871597.1 tetratricopeptide repeat protein [Terriglobales bacterium]